MVSIDISEEEVKFFKGLLDYFRTLSDGGVNALIEKQLLLMLDHSLPFFSHLTMEHSFPEIKRLTINRNVSGKNKRIYNTKLLKYPPPNKVERYGRCNLPGQSVLYSGFDEIVILGELKPTIGDLITQSTWRLKANHLIKYCPIFKNQPKDKNIRNKNTWKINKLYEEKLKDYPKNVRDQIDALVQFVSDGFTKYVHPNNHRDYIFNAYFAKNIYRF